jgi:6-phosphogluconolactonase
MQNYSMLKATNDFAFKFKDEKTVYRNLLGLILEIAKEAIAQRDAFYWAISGGSTPLPLFDLMIEEKNSLDWTKVYTFWVDERCVSPGHPDSNFGMAHKKFLQFLPIHYFRMEAGQTDRELAAQDYEQILQKIVPIADNGIPELDLVLLGMGDDGHTASLFPQTTALMETRKLVTPVYVEKLDSWRLTLTYPILNQAITKIIPIKGASKKAIFEEIQELKGQKYPVQGIKDSIWMVQ